MYRAIWKVSDKIRALNDFPSLLGAKNKLYWWAALYEEGVGYIVFPSGETKYILKIEVRDYTGKEFNNG